MFNKNENKKARKIENAKNRVTVNFNTGTRTFKAQKIIAEQKVKKFVKTFQKTIDK